MHFADVILETTELRWHLCVRYTIVTGYQPHAYGVLPVYSIDDVVLHSIESLELLWGDNPRPETASQQNLSLPLTYDGNRLLFRRHAEAVLSALKADAVRQIAEYREHLEHAEAGIM